MIVSVGEGGEAEGGVDSAFGERVGGCAEGGEVGCAAGREDCLGRGDGGGCEGDGGNGCGELHLCAGVWVCEERKGLGYVCVRVRRE